MFNPTDNQKKLANYLKEKDFEAGFKLSICLCCDTDEQAREMLEYCQNNPNLEDYELLQKVVEISEKT